MSTKIVTTNDLLDYLPNYALPESGYEYLHDTLSSEPSREVGQFARKNVCGAYSSPSQGITIQYESHTAELPWLLRWELDQEILGFRDQPPTIELRKADKNGRMRDIMYTPDFLLLKTESAAVVEVKTPKNLLKLSAKYPEQWKFDDDSWHYLPAKKAFEEIGLNHIVCCLNDMHSIETNNLKTLIKVSESKVVIVGDQLSRIYKLLEENAWLTLSELKNGLSNVSYTELYHLILCGQIYADLEYSLITDTDSCYVAASRELLSARKEHALNPPEVVQSMSTSIVPNRVELERALVRLERVESDDQSRHVKRLRKKIADSKARGETPLQALIMPVKGNTSPKISQRKMQDLDEHIVTYYISGRRPSILAAWSHYRNWIKDKHPNFSGVSRRTYQRYVDLQKAETVAFGRGGKRAANAAAATTDVLERSLKATRPFERVSIDHTLMKLRVRVVDSNGNEYSKKPWLTALVDDSSGFWLSFFISFKDPSKRSLAMVFRSCVREFGKLPEMVHSDRGADLRSVYYRGLLAHYGSTADWSPAGHSRFNSQVERTNKQLKGQWVSQRPGTTVGYEETRKYSKGYRPEDNANIELDDLFTEIEAFRNHYNATVIGSESVPPDKLFNEGLSKFPFSGIPVTFDDEFLLVTAYDTNKADYKIGNAGEIMFNGLRFSHPELRRLRPKRSRTELRIDPEDPYRIYCKVDGNWVTALNSKHVKFASRSVFARWAEAIRVGEGRAIRTAAKQDANELKAKELDSFDREYEEKVELPKETLPIEHPFPELLKTEDPEDLIERLRKKTLDGDSADEEQT